MSAKVEEFEKQVTGYTLNLDKTTEKYNTAKTSLADAVDKLHQTNRVRHELEILLKAE